MTTDTRSRKGLLGLLGATLLALIVLGTGISDLRLEPGRALPLGDLQQFFQDLFRTQQPTRSALGDLLRLPLILLVWVVLPFVLVSLIVSPSLRRQLLSRLVSGLALIAVVYLAIQGWRAANGPGESGAVTGGNQAPPIVGRLPSPPAFITQPPDWLILTVSLLIAASVVWIAWSVWRRATDPEEPLALLSQEAEAALQRLQAGAEMRDTVVRCYLEMCRVLAIDRGLERAHDMTPREFERRLGEVGLQDEHIRRLTRLFERVRYGAQDSRESEDQEAAACLSAIVRAYGS